MPLSSDHFTKPTRNARLEACLVDDGSHVTLRTPREKGDYVSRIQAALFLIVPDVNLGDELGAEEYGPLTADAVFQFKDSRTPKILNAALHQVVPDNIVGKLTIAALDEEMLKRQGPKPAGPKLTVTAVPLSGFSALRLARTREGFLTDPSQPLCQMVPVGGIRNLIVSTGSAADRISIRIPDPSHTRAFIAKGLITVRGGPSVGEDAAEFTINGKDTDAIRLIVRAESPITVHFHALADVKAGKGSVGFDGAIDPLIKGLNRLYSGQANIRFNRGQFKVTDTINGRKIDFDKPIVVNPRIRDPNRTDPSRQLFTLGAFLPQAINPVKEINVFITPGLVDLRNAAGTSSIFDEKLCWGKSRAHEKPTGLQSHHRS